jgi:hypothetical protein
MYIHVYDVCAHTHVPTKKKADIFTGHLQQLLSSFDITCGNHNLVLTIEGKGSVGTRPFRCVIHIRRRSVKQNDAGVICAAESEIGEHLKVLGLV